MINAIEKIKKQAWITGYLQAMEDVETFKLSKKVISKLDSSKAIVQFIETRYKESEKEHQAEKDTKAKIE